MVAGYSGKPLAQKLGIRSGMRVVALDAPAAYRSIVADLPDDVRVTTDVSGAAELVHVFTTQRAGLEQRLAQLREVIRPAGMIWVSWPKRASKVPTDVTEDGVRAAALASGLVDVKVCAVDDVWSGLKLVIRTRDR